MNCNPNEQACSKRTRGSEPAPAHAARKTKWTHFFPQSRFGRGLALARSRRRRERFEGLRCHYGHGLLRCEGFFFVSGFERNLIR